MACKVRTKRLQQSSIAPTIKKQKWECVFAYVTAATTTTTALCTKSIYILNSSTQGCKKVLDEDDLGRRPFSQPGEAAAAASLKNVEVPPLRFFRPGKKISNSKVVIPFFFAPLFSLLHQQKTFSCMGCPLGERLGCYYSMLGRQHECFHGTSIMYF